MNKRSRFWIRTSPDNTSGKIHFAYSISPSETSHTMELPTPKLALIREKRALFFPDNHRMCPIRQSGFESELKMAANSTYWEAKLNVARGVARSKGKEGLYITEPHGLPSHQRFIHFRPSRFILIIVHAAAQQHNAKTGRTAGMDAG